MWDSQHLDEFLRKLMGERATPPLEATPEQLATCALWVPKTVFMLLRVGATGRKETPPLFDTLAQIGQTKVIERLGLAIQKLR